MKDFLAAVAVVALGVLVAYGAIIVLKLALTAIAVAILL